MNVSRVSYLCAVLASAFSILLTVLLTTPCSAHELATPLIDAPELAKRGAYSVGVTQLNLVNPQQIDIVKFDFKSQKLPRYDRQLPIQLWYPATASDGDETELRYQAHFSPGIAKDANMRYAYQINALAHRDAKPIQKERFPFVLVSHGFNGDFSFMSYLCENLASKGYVVAAIDHQDFGEDDSVPQTLWFASALLNRAQDQAFVLEQLPHWLEKNTPQLFKIAAFEKVGIVGYSMGGYGLMSLLGAGIDTSSKTYQLIPGELLKVLADDTESANRLKRPEVKAAVAMAPWGAQPPYRTWSENALAEVKTPILVMSGSHDDIADHDRGVSWLFENLGSIDRYMLVFQNARHNIGGNPAPMEAYDNFYLMEFFNDPVWRKSRITAINQHFVTAFLNWHLKGQKDMASYFDVPTTYADQGTWPVAFGAGDSYSGGKKDLSNSYWRGFQRRSALGLELHKGKQKPIALSDERLSKNSSSQTELE